ncbi:hypothetical protein EZS27_019543 [termite gut metagenome]|uniref:Transposase IS200-like domain-containing protein n=1 Tax=termite gut metagenome TaxID=433724 RepID=A0A5J4RG02_9ZZZZ
MPNHVHGIIDVSANDDAGVGATLAVALNNNTVALNNNTVAPHDNMVAPNNNTVVLNNNTVAPHDNMVALNDNTVVPNFGMDIANGATANRATARVAPTVGNIVGAYKSLVMNRCLEIYKSKNECMGKLWQRNYYEHIIRNERSHQIISEYIANNPVNWKDDKFYCEL